MKVLPNAGLVAATLIVAGCTFRESEAERKLRKDNEAKALAEAARKEMEELPKIFRTPDYFKKNLPGTISTGGSPAQPAKR